MAEVRFYKGKNPIAILIKSRMNWAVYDMVEKKWFTTSKRNCWRKEKESQFTGSERKMKIVVLHWHGVCPYCKKQSCIYAEFRRPFDPESLKYGSKMPHGFRCDSCDEWISDEEFDKMEKIECPCPKEVLGVEEQMPLIKIPKQRAKQLEKTLLFLKPDVLILTLKFCTNCWLKDCKKCVWRV